MEVSARLSCVIFACLVLLGQCHGGTKEHETNRILKKLAKLTEDEQMTEDAPYRSWVEPLKFEGNYKMRKRFNMFGDSNQTFGRHNLQQNYLSVFPSSFVAQMLLDASLYGNAPLPSQASIDRVSKLYPRFHDHDGFATSVQRFYVEHFDRKKGRFVQTCGINDVDYEYIAAHIHIPPNLLPKLMSGESYPPHISDILEQRNFSYYPVVPPDFDDTAVNMIFGGILSQHKHSYPESWKIWQKDNTNLTSVIDAVKKYAYRPFSEKWYENTIDPRSYYIMKDFIDQAKTEGRDLAITPVWVSNLKEQRTDILKMKMIFWGMNSIDVFVVGNSVLSFITSFISGLIPTQTILSDPDLQLILESNTDLVIHFAKKVYGDRIDIVTLYYSSPYQGLWFLSRNLMYLENYRLNHSIPIPVFKKFYHQLSSVMRNEVTSYLMAQKTAGDGGDYFYDDFLGNADTSYYGAPIERHEDRIYSTSSAANALVYTWTVYDDVKGLHWLDSTPAEVKHTVYGCAQWLQKNTLTGEYRIDGSTMTLDYHGMQALPHWYPANFFEYLNGTKIKSFDVIPAEPTALGLQGYVEPEVYEQMVKAGQFGVATPTARFIDYNRIPTALPFFSCKAYVYSSVMLTLAVTSQVDDRMLRCLETCEQTGT